MIKINDKFMNKLWAYGCSWTNYNPQPILSIKLWPEIVGEYLNLITQNRGVPGQSIASARINLSYDLHRIKKDDVVVFQFSYPDRIVFPYLDGEKVGRSWYYYDIISSKNGEFKAKKYETYTDFILTFRYELLINEFVGTLPIFDYIENEIGATIKYWFVNVTLLPRDNPTKQMLETVEKIIWNHKRCVTFPFTQTYHNPLKHFIEADKMIYAEELRIRDEAQHNKEWSQMKWTRTDEHPGQSGHIRIAKEIIKSINDTVNTDDLEVEIRKKRLL